MREAFLCGGSGKLTPEAQAELESFRDHLADHKGQRIVGCRFCAERSASAAARAAQPQETSADDV